MFPILIGITLVTFFLFNYAGGDPATQLAGKNASVEQIEMIKAELGLNGTLFEQYGFFLKQIVTFDYGRSWSSKQKVSTMIFGESFAQSPIFVSLSLTLPAFILTFLLSVSISLMLTFMRGTRIDKAVMVICLAAISFSSLVYILFLQNNIAYKLGWFPISGWDPSWIDRWQYLVLPIIIFIVLSLGSSILFYRTVFLDEMYQDYVRTARSKGLDSRAIMFKHVLRNAMIPIVTVIVLSIPFLITGSILIESFFGIPGLGNLMVQAINNADFPVIKAFTVMMAILYMLFQLLTDVLYAIVDPKVQLR